MQEQAANEEANPEEVRVLRALVEQKEAQIIAVREELRAARQELARSAVGGATSSGEASRSARSTAGTAPEGEELKERSPILVVSNFAGPANGPATANVARVLVTTRGNYRTVWPHNPADQGIRLHSRSSVFGERVRAVYDVDLGIRRLAFDVDLPGVGDGFAFRAHATVEWQVLDPALVVRSQLRDVEPLIRPAVVETMRRIARGFEADQYAAAERAINEALAGELLGSNDGARLRDAAEHATSGGHIGREHGLRTRTTASLQPQLVLSGEVRPLRRQVEAESLRRELQLSPEQNRQDVEAGRMAIYREALAAGDIDFMVFQLAQSPDELTAVARIVREQELIGQRLTLDFVNKLIESGAIERWQINDQAKAALEWLSQSTSAVLGPPAVESGAGEVDAPQQDAADDFDDEVDGPPAPPAPDSPGPK